MKTYMPHMPDYLDRQYAKLEVLQSSDEKITAINMKPVQVQSGGRNMVSISSYLLLECPLRTGREECSRHVVPAFMKFLSRYDKKYQLATNFLGEMSRLAPHGKKLHPMNFIARIEAYGAAVMTGRKPPKDTLAELWWELKFSPQNQKRAVSVRNGDSILLFLRQHGYFEKSGNFLTDLRRKLDFGHSLIAIRKVGHGPEGDLLLNPGAKNFDLGEVTLPNSPDPDVLNMIDTPNPWIWAETQIYRRYMKVAFRTLLLNDLQLKAIHELSGIANGLAFGPAVTFSNNCADVAARILNFILPINAVFEPGGFFGVATPSGVSRDASHRFGTLGLVKMDNIRDQNPGDETPPTSYQDGFYDGQKLSDLKSFREYLAWERENLF